MQVDLTVRESSLQPVFLPNSRKNTYPSHLEDAKKESFLLAIQILDPENNALSCQCHAILRYLEPRLSEEENSIESLW